ncbi:MAG: cation:proton antiporter [Candidatus Eiseniibacteriota bacterium]|jgi:NhaP-type Na+/H+ or K+/H+ antiporter
MLDSVYAILGLVMLLLGLLGGIIKGRLWVSEPLVALVIGVLVGPAVLKLVDPAEWGLAPMALIEQIARLSLAISLVGVALRLPDTYVRRCWRPAAVVLLVVMPLMWIVSSLLIWIGFGWSMLLALAAGAVITPTDPVVASSIVTGKLAERTIPAQIRHLLSLESGANDGLAYLLLAAPLLLIAQPTGEAMRSFVLDTLLREVVLAIAAGIALGWIVARLELWSARRALGERTALLGLGVAMSLAVLGLLGVVHSDGILGVFAAALVFNWMVRGQDQARYERVQEVLTRFFELPVFLLLGALLPWSAWRALGWTSGPVIVGILLLRRLPAVLVFRHALGLRADLAGAVFFGWFGPMGVAAILWSAVAVERTGRPELWSLATLAVAASVTAHGVTATPASKLLGRHHDARAA